MQDECQRVQKKLRGIRRHHRVRIIRKFQSIYRNWGFDNWKTNGLITAGRGSISCGCCCCANPRRAKRGFGDSPLTIQERKAEIYKKNWEIEDEVSEL
jgi:hypothetical protein